MLTNGKKGDKINTRKANLVAIKRKPGERCGSKMKMMTVIYIGEKHMDYLVKDNYIDLTPGKEYKVVDETKHDYRVIDDSGEDYLYPKHFFEMKPEENNG